MYKRGIYTPPRMKEHGFTLLEVLVAVAILGVGIVTAMQLFGNSMGAVSKADRHSKAVFLARGILDSVFFDKVEIGETEGTFDQPFEGYKWKKTVSEYTKKDAEEDAEGLIDALELRLAQVNVAVNYEGDGGEEKRLVSLDTLVTYFEEKKD